MSARDQLSDYLLGELAEAERERFEAALARDRALAAEVRRLRPVVSRLEGLEPAAWDPAAVPVPALPPLPAPSAPPARERWWRRSLAVRPLPAAALAVALLALGVAAGLLARGDDGAPTSAGRVIALAPVEPLGGRATGTATFASSGRRASVRLAGLPPSRDGEFYELWLLNSADDLVALGSFTVPASGAVDVSVPLPGGAGGFAAIDVSVEPGDGDPAHSRRSVLRAPLAAS